MKFGKFMLSAGIMTATLCGLTAAEMVKDGDKVAIIGDSITEQKQYTNVMETYIMACSGLKNVQVMQFGWSGERTTGFVGRMAFCFDFFPFSVATTLYGMEDGGYNVFNPNVGKAYADNSAKIAKFMNEKNVKFLAGSPGAVDTDTYTARNNCPAEGYNNTLNELGKLGQKAAEENGAKFVNVHQIMIDAMAVAKKEYGPAYHVCGKYGYLPDMNGHLVMAYAFLKNLGFDGMIGTIDMNYADGKTTATEDHKVLNSQVGSVQLESTRYPFVFNTGKNPNQNASILPSIPFNKELNRFMLVVKNLPADKATVQFGSGKKSFTKTQLEAGINLADEFVAETPFRANFDKVANAVRAKQNYETWIGKQFLFLLNNPNIPATDPKVKEARKTLSDAVKEQWESFEKKVQDAIVPVKYTVTVTPEE